MSFIDRLKHAWDAFNSRDSFVTDYNYVSLGQSSSYRPDRVALSKGAEKSLITSVYTRIALDCADTRIEHVRLDDKGRYIETLDTGLNNCLTLEANKDQSAWSLVEDIVLSMFDEGDVAVLPVKTDINPKNTSSFEILALRTGKILEWYPDHVKIRAYDGESGQMKDAVWPKSKVAIIENPFREIMNAPNSTVKRLGRKLAILDAIDEQSGAGKLDLIIQLPYAIKGELKRAEAEKRRKDLQEQLKDGQYGVAYTDGTEHVIQLNRPLENNLMKQIEYLVNLAYSQLGITTGIMDGTADANTMMNYQSRVIGLIMTVITTEFRRKFLTKTARSQKQSIVFFKDPFKIIPIEKLADIADKFTRNEIITSNEMRQIVGLKPVQDPEADELRNKNLNRADNERPVAIGKPGDPLAGPKEEVKNLMGRKIQNGEEKV